MIYDDIDFKIDRIEVSAKQRSLKSEFTIEPLQDLICCHGCHIPYPYKKFSKRFSKAKRKILRQKYFKEQDQKLIDELSARMSVDLNKEIENEIGKNENSKD